jgi:5-methylcytosine-specific restriction endonuclease McrBC regulatory subunit McrC
MIKKIISKTYIGDFYYKIVGSKGKEEHILSKKLGMNFLRQTYDIHLDMNLKLHEIMLNSFGIQGVYPFVNSETAMFSRALKELIYNKQFYKDEVRKLIKPTITQYIKKSGKVVDTNHLFNSNKDLLVRVFDFQFVRDLLSKHQIDQILKNPEQYYMLILQLVYIFIFNELFITGKYDTQFYMDGCDVSLNSILN